jgi:hypothetical protein
VLRSKTRVIATLALAGSLVAGACGSDPDQETSGSTATSAAPNASTEGVPQAAFTNLTGTSTSVDLDPATAKVLTDNGVTVTPVEPATVSTSGGKTTVSFPITAGYVALYPKEQTPYVRGAFSHSGGLTFTAGGKSLTVTDFIVNPGSSELFATIPTGEVVQLLDLDGTDLQISQNSQGNVLLDGTVAKLSDTAAKAMNATFGVSLFKAGIPLGVVHIVAAGVSDPGGAPQAAIGDLTGEATSVDLDPATAKVLTDNGVTVTAVAPATVSTAGGATTVSFPITAGYVALYPTDQQPFVRGAFSHSGGLTFSAGGKSLTVTDFVVNPGSSELYATVDGSGDVVQLLDLDGTNVKVTTGSNGLPRLDGTVAKLSTTAAEALNTTFGVSLFKAGIPLGVVHVVPAGSAA